MSPLILYWLVIPATLVALFGVLALRTQRRQVAELEEKIRAARLAGHLRRMAADADQVEAILQDYRAALAHGGVSYAKRQWYILKVMAAMSGPRLVARSSAQGITNVAVLLAGRKRSSLRDEWRSHLAGETGRGLPSGQRIGAALGFIVAALRYRLQDAAAAGWRLSEAVLKSRRWSNVVVFAPTGLAAVIIFRRDGAAGTLVAYESIAAIGGSLYAIVRVGRWYRDVKPPEPKARIKE